MRIATEMQIFDDRVTPNFKNVSSRMLDRMVARASDIYVDGEWLVREAALVSAIIVQWAVDLRDLASRVHRSSGDLLMEHVAHENVEEIGNFCELLNIDRGFPLKLIRDMEICKLKPGK